MKIFILEDDPARIEIFHKQLANQERVTLAVDVESALETFTGDYDLYLLDHDLGGRTYVDPKDPNTGSAFLTHEKVRNAMQGHVGPIAFVHSFDHPAARGMLKTLEDLGVVAVAVPFSPRLFEIVDKLSKEWDAKR